MIPRLNHNLAAHTLLCDPPQIKELLASSDDEEEEEVKPAKVEKSYVPKITGETGGERATNTYL